MTEAIASSETTSGSSRAGAQTHPAAFKAFDKLREQR